MVTFKLVFGLSALAGVLAAPSHLDLTKRQTITTSQTGTSNGYYYSFWTNGGGTVDYTNGNSGEYSITWENDGDFTAGKGWNPGSAQDITFSGTFTTTGNAYLAVYGWFTDPLVEYYILENYGDYNPGSAMTEVGSLTSDGSAYTIYTNTQTNQPSIEGTSTFQQYWSIRQDLRSSGTVTTSNHFDAWNNLGLTTGTFNYQIVSTEGYESSGSADITVGSSTGSGGTSPTSTVPVSTPTATLLPLYAQCGGNEWTGPTTCAPPNTCQVLNPGYYQCLS